MPRFTYGAASCGNCKATCLNSSSASVLLPERIKPTARSKSALPRAVTATGAVEPDEAPGAALLPAWPGAAAPGFAAVTGSDDASFGFDGADPQATNSIAA